MNYKQIYAFKKKARRLAARNTTMFIIKWLFLITIFTYILLVFSGKVLGCSTIEFLANNIFFIIFVVVLSIIFVILCSYVHRENIYDKLYNEQLQNYSKITADIMFIPDTPIEILPIKVKDSTYQNLILSLPKIAKFYGILRNNGKIYIYVEFPNANEKIVIDDVSKEDFMTYYKFINDWE